MRTGGCKKKKASPELKAGRTRGMMMLRAQSKMKM